MSRRATQRPKFAAWLRRAGRPLHGIFSVYALAILLFAPAALVAHELQDAQNWTQGSHQGKHVKPACQICTVYAAFEHALASSHWAVHADTCFGDVAAAVHAGASIARIAPYRSRAPPRTEAVIA
jgi:hypothetical protein